MILIILSERKIDIKMTINSLIKTWYIYAITDYLITKMQQNPSNEQLYISSLI